ncbi:UNKNOWN [Stylonychia lemnae]|uniref:Uncharacterized protein n=1 Tax=Stylonychia lemnae TaxID=5949 RepID=A0A078B565_STYLE|nr:UNKNOWN [Stylonychia lemnae]|eukprot:CDW88683.1 UNKNOWN [Stylonychia lemnae]
MKIIFNVSFLIIEKVNNLTCFGDSTGNFPLVLGGIKDQTKYVSIDMDSNDNILMSGWTKSWDLSGTSTTLPILVILDRAGTYTLSMRYHFSTAGEFSTAKYRSSDETQIVGILGTTSYELKIYLISASDGSILAKYATQSNVALKVSIANDCFVINGDRMYLAMRTGSGYTQIMGFQMTTADILVDFYKQAAQSSSSNNQFDSMYLFGSNQQLLLSGYIRNGGQNYWTLWSFKISDQSNLINLAFRSSNMQSQKMIYKNDGITNHVYRVGSNSNSKLYFNYVVVDDGGIVSSQYLYQYDFSDSASCKSIHADSASTSLDSRKDNSLKFLSAALMSADISQSCLNRDESTYTEVIIDSVTLTADTCPDTFNNDKTLITITYTDTSNNAISKGSLTSTTLIYQSWCSASQPVPQSVAVSDGIYEIFSGNKWFPFTQFTTDLGCSDATWTYSFAITFDGTSQGTNPFSYDTNTPLQLKAASTTEAHAGTYSIKQLLLHLILL